MTEREPFNTAYIGECRCCGAWLKSLEYDSYCASCAGVRPEVQDEARTVALVTLKNARLVLAKKLAQRDPEAEVSWWRNRVSELERSLGLEPGQAA